MKQTVCFIVQLSSFILFIQLRPSLPAITIVSILPRPSRRRGAAMPPRPAWTFCALFFIGSAVAAGPVTPAMKLWQQGQTLMAAGNSAEAIAYFQQSLKADPDLARNHLSLAAAYADQGRDELALIHMDRYVRMQPDHYEARLHYADMLLRSQQETAARVQYEMFIADVQDREGLADEHLVHCHSRLMEIYEAAEDEYGEHLNRGLGLFHLARRRAAVDDPDDELPVEGLLFRAAGELMAAWKCRPDEARPCWYLSEVWSRLGQRQPADKWLRRAEAAALLSHLTPSETRGLHLALGCRAEVRK
jgi:tetratricopeptide (TPR) repeat protein